MTLPSVAVVTLVASFALAASTSAQTQTPPSPDTQPAGKATTAPAGDGTNEGNPGYPMQDGETYKGPPGKGAVTHDDAHGYKRT